MGHVTYKIWLKKPNYFRMEAMPAGTNQPTGILVGDGAYFCKSDWPREKPRYGWEQTGKHAEDYEKHRSTFYMKQRTPVGQHSIGHEAVFLGAGMSMTILDPSTFHGYTDSMQAYIDGVRKVGIEKVGTENCDVVEVSVMKHQRSWQLWLSQRDHLPRKLQQIVRVSSDIVFDESWSDVIINAEIPSEASSGHRQPGGNSGASRTSKKDCSSLAPSRLISTWRPSTGKGSSCRTSVARWSGSTNGGVADPHPAGRTESPKTV